jgi:hypothetical protein
MAPITRDQHFTNSHPTNTRDPATVLHSSAVWIPRSGGMADTVVNKPEHVNTSGHQYALCNFLWRLFGYCTRLRGKCQCPAGNNHYSTSCVSMFGSERPQYCSVVVQCRPNYCSDAVQTDKIRAGERLHYPVASCGTVVRVLLEHGGTNVDARGRRR